MDRLIRWICASDSHRVSVEPGLTRYEGQWAVCPQLLGNDHEWLDTGGVELSEAVTRWRRLGDRIPQGSTPSPAS